LSPLQSVEKEITGQSIRQLTYIENK